MCRLRLTAPPTSDTSTGETIATLPETSPARGLRRVFERAVWSASSLHLLEYRIMIPTPSLPERHLVADRRDSYDSMSPREQLFGSLFVFLFLLLIVLWKSL